jgi:ribosomal protein S18 acetylase RimI-like enzyme
MDNLYTLSLENTFSPNDAEFVREKLNEYNIQYFEAERHQGVSVFWRDKQGNIVAGLLGGTFWGWLHINDLWVGENLRNQGLGKALINAAEQEALRRGCKYAHLETHDFQALEFYLKQGYEVFGELDDLPAGHKKYFLKKTLDYSENIPNG